MFRTGNLETDGYTKLCGAGDWLKEMKSDQLAEGFLSRIIKRVVISPHNSLSLLKTTQLYTSEG